MPDLYQSKRGALRTPPPDKKPPKPTSFLVALKVSLGLAALASLMVSWSSTSLQYKTLLHQRRQESRMDLAPLLSANGKSPGFLSSTSMLQHIQQQSDSQMTPEFLRAAARQVRTGSSPLRHLNLVHVFAPNEQNLAWATLYRAQEYLKNKQAQAAKTTVSVWDSLTDIRLTIVCVIRPADRDQIWNQEPPLCQPNNTVLSEGVDSLSDLVGVARAKFNETEKWHDFVIFGNSNVAVTQRFYIYLRRAIQSEMDIDALGIRSYPLQQGSAKSNSLSSPHVYTTDDMDYMEQELWNEAENAQPSQPRADAADLYNTLTYVVSAKLLDHVNMEGLQVGNNNLWSRLFRPVLEGLVANHFTMVGNDGRQDDEDLVQDYSYHLVPATNTTSTLQTRVLSASEARAILPCAGWSGLDSTALSAVANGTANNFAVPDSDGWIQSARACAKLTQGLSRYLLTKYGNGSHSSVTQPPAILTAKGLTNLDRLVHGAMTTLTSWSQEDDVIYGTVVRTAKPGQFDVGETIRTSAIDTERRPHPGMVVKTESGSRYLLLKPLNVTEQQEQMERQRQEAQNRPPPSLTKWILNSDGTLSGILTESTDPELPNGSRIRTSKVQGKVEAGNIVWTKSGSRYYLLPRE